MITLLDNTVLSNFALVGCLELLRIALGDTGAIVDEVIAEYEVGVELGRVPASDWSWLLRLTLTKTEHATYERLRLRLNAGEAACLALANSRGYQVLTDDRVARDIARHHRIPVSGTLGILVLLVDQGHLNLAQADDVLRRMMALGCRSPVSSLAEIV